MPGDYNVTFAKTSDNKFTIAVKHENTDEQQNGKNDDYDNTKHTHRQALKMQKKTVFTTHQAEKITRAPRKRQSTMVTSLWMGCNASGTVSPQSQDKKKL